MSPLNFEIRRIASFGMNSVACKCFALLVTVLIVRVVFFTNLSEYDWIGIKNSLQSVEIYSIRSNSDSGIRSHRFLEVPQIVWGLNNQKIAFARACLTARMLNRTLLMPSLSASLFYKEVDQLKPIWFDKVFDFERFNSLCKGFVQLGRYSDVLNQTDVVELPKGSGRKWTPERDLDQLMQFREDPYDRFEVIKITGKNPFLWHDHWPLKDYAEIFGCLVLVDEFAKEADKVISRIRMAGEEARARQKIPERSLLPPIGYVAVHMRIEKDWMIHCKKMEHKSNINQICSSKEEIIERVGKIVNSSTPTVVYLAVADSLLEDKTIFEGWKAGLIPVDKNKLGAHMIYERHPYLIKSAIDYEVCSRADVFFGNSFSTFSSLVALGRTQLLLQKSSVTSSCADDAIWPSYAYNILGKNGGPQRWVTNMSDTSLQAISYGTNNVSCKSS